ncbi:unnamed protein product [Oikopleura dioica]|uniref:Uncharacterized protein n=1 Tax=Oikopleura dioica TaxID=34765 RepID=E4WWW8_OIKDI|nr:unnamed protein product [Oikopleura dioica]
MPRKTLLPSVAFSALFIAFARVFPILTNKDHTRRI